MRPLATQASQPTVPQAKPIALEEAEGGLSLSDIFRMIASHWLFIVGCIVVCTGLAYLYARSITPIYEASGTLRIDPTRTGSIGLGSIAGGASYFGNDEIETDIAILKSNSVAVEIFNRLTDDEFRRFAGGPRSQLSFTADTLKLSPDQEALLAKLSSDLTAKEVGTTELITVSFRSTDPQMAATIANAAMDAYLKETFDSEYGSVKQVRTWLSSQMDELRNQSVEAQNKLTQFQEQNNILETGENSNTTLDALKTISEDLTKSRAEQITREAQMRAADAGDPEVIAAIFPSPTMTALEAQRATLTAQVNQLSSKFDINYPPLQEARKALEKNDKQFQNELNFVKARVKQDYDTSHATETLLQKRYDDQLAKAYALNRQEATYGVLVSQAKTSRELYDELQKSLQQAGVSAGLSAVNSMLVDRARASSFPVEPKKSIIIGFGLMLGLFCGLGAALLREIITDSAKTEEQLEHVLRSHVLAIVPEISNVKSKSTEIEPDKIRASPQMVSIHSPLSRSAEPYRNLRNSLLLSGENLKTILVTSSIAGEGKSTTAANLGVVLAQNGAKVLLVDADLRRPRIHALFGLENLQGISNLILGEPIDDPIHVPLQSLPNLNVLTAGKRVTLPAEALSSPRLHQLLADLEQRYDYIVVDSAPLLLVSDSLPLASWADATLLVVRYNTVSVAALRRVHALLAQAQTSLIGAVFNSVPQKSAIYGGYSYEGNGYYE